MIDKKTKTYLQFAARTKNHNKYLLIEKYARYKNSTSKNNTKALYRKKKNRQIQLCYYAIEELARKGQERNAQNHPRSVLP